MKRIGPALLTMFAAVAGNAPSALCQEFPAITNRDYTLDMYQGSVLGSTRIIGMGGAQVAAAEGSPGSVVNPAAVGLRTATSKGNWDWDFHVDAINPLSTNDADNNGQIEGKRSKLVPVSSTGIMYQRRRWGIGFNVLANYRQVSEEGATPVTTSALNVDLTFGMNFFNEQLIVGLALRTASVSLFANDATVFSQADYGTHSGVVFKPHRRNYRLGVAFIKSLGKNDSIKESCDPLNCEGYILPDQIHIPWRLSTGIAWRFAPTSWNMKVPDYFRDERALTLAADLVVSGAVEDGAGIEAFGDMQLQPSGRDHNLSLRMGAELEWIPGRLRVQGGSYYEPARFEAPDGSDVRGRFHGTLGFEVRLFSFHFLDNPYRLRLAMAGDAARDYANIALSLGFWD